MEKGEGEQEQQDKYNQHREEIYSHKTPLDRF